jgi:hypothetical protein
MSQAIQIKANAGSITGDMGEQSSLPKMGKWCQNADSSLPARVLAAFCEISRRPLVSRLPSARQRFAAVHTTGDTGAHGKDFGKIFGNVPAVPVAFARYGNYNSNNEGGCRG